MSILEILEAHKPVTLRYRADDVVIRCACGGDMCGDTTPLAEATHRAHLAEVLEEHMWEQIAHERAHTIQMIREQAHWERDETDDYGRVTLEGYLTIGTREVEKIEGGTGFDRMCFSVIGWEERLREQCYEAWREGVATLDPDAVDIMEATNPYRKEPTNG